MSAIATTDLELISAAIAEGRTRLPETHKRETSRCMDCGCLLVELPRSIQVVRSYAVRLPGLKRGIRHCATVEYTHIARADGSPACPACIEDPAQCEDHTPDQCDTPQPVPCVCGDPVTPDGDACKLHAEAEDEWDKDRYLSR